MSDIQVSPMIRVGRFLRDCGYDLADRVGQRINTLEDGIHPELGILRKKTSAKASFFDMILGTSPAEFLGVFKFYKKRVWELHYFGSQNTEEVKRLIMLIENEFKTKTSVTLASEDPQLERTSGY